MRRFYKTAEVADVADGFAVKLDGKPVLTPAKAPLVVCSRALAHAIAEEWATRGDTFSPHELALTRLASTAIDLVRARRDSVVAEIAKYAGTDLVCYRAAHPPELAARQHAAWQPLLDWATLRYDAPLVVTQGIAPVTQPAASLAAFAAAIAAHDAMTLAALHLATTAAGSVVVGLALIEGRVDSDAAFAAAELDESFEIERWGEDAEQARRRAGLKEDLALAERFVGLHRGG